LQRRVSRSTVWPGPITKDGQKRFRVITVGNVNLAIDANQQRKLAGLNHIPAQQNKKFSFSGALIPLHKHVSAEQRKHFFGSNLLTDAGHAQKGA
jgi:hypothetical protein